MRKIVQVINVVRTTKENRLLKEIIWKYLCQPTQSEKFFHVIDVVRAPARGVIKYHI